MTVGRNLLYSIAGSVLPMIVALVTVPIYLETIGEARFGVLAIIWLAAGFFGIFDLGLGRACAQRIASLRGDNRQVASVVHSALLTSLVFGALACLVIWPFAPGFIGLMTGDSGMPDHEWQGAAPWAVLLLPVIAVSSVYSGILQGFERFLALNAIGVLGTVLYLVLPLLAATAYGAELPILVAAVLVARTTCLALLAVASRKSWRGQAMQGFSVVEAARLLSFGGWVSVSSLISPLMVVLDRMLIALTSGPVAVTHYTVPFQVAQRTTVFSGAVANTLFPRFASATAEDERVMAQMGIKLVVLVTTPVMAALVLFASPLLEAWISADMAMHATLVAQLILLAFWVNGLAMIPFGRLQALGRPRRIAVIHALELLPYCACLYAALVSFGVVGAAAVFLLRVFVDFLLLSYWTPAGLAIAKVSVVPFCLMIGALIVGRYDIGDAGPEWLGTVALTLSAIVWLGHSLRDGGVGALVQFLEVRKMAGEGVVR